MVAAPVMSSGVEDAATGDELPMEDAVAGNELRRGLGTGEDAAVGDEVRVRCGAWTGEDAATAAPPLFVDVSPAIGSAVMRRCLDATQTRSSSSLRRARRRRPRPPLVKWVLFPGPRQRSSLAATSSSQLRRELSFG
uniref:Uncharacterized protein n=1 Tax=Oryza sativa subsp. japonica TaxID=39947 RepID=Q9FW62_ORYSJ|nr:hypothetical protein [Oryza sativa Japonica Group]